MDKNAWLIEMAAHVSKRSTCLRRNVGCVLVNARGHVLATGYNGVAAGLPNCNEIAVADRCTRCGAELKASNMCMSCSHVHLGSDGLTHPNACSGALAPPDQPQSAAGGCEAIHAEQNALLQCGDVSAIEACFVTLSPCVTCTKLLMNTSCARIVFRDAYEPQHDAARDLWARKAGRLWVRA